MLTDSVKKQILQAISGLNGSSSSSISPGTYMGLSLTVPTSSGTNFTEPSTSAGYERIYINSQQTSGPQYPFEFVPGSNNSQVQNKYEIHFNVATADWKVDDNNKTIKYVGIFSGGNSTSGGTLIAYGHLVNDQGEEVEIEVKSGHIATIVKGQAKISIDVE